MSRVAPAGVDTPHDGDDKVEDLLASIAGCGAFRMRFRGRTSAAQMHQSSHQTLRVSLMREYILPITKVRETITSGHVKACTVAAMFTSPPRGGGPVAGMVKSKREGQTEIID